MMNLSIYIFWKDVNLEVAIGRLPRSLNMERKSLDVNQGIGFPNLHTMSYRY